MTEKDTSRLSQTKSLPLDVLVLAAGLGTRMKSQRAKVLHELGGRPLIGHVIRQARELTPRKIYVIVGYDADAVEAAVRREPDSDRIVIAKQQEQRGTGHAVMSAAQHLSNSDSTLLVLSGDVPLVRPETLRKLIDHHHQSHAACSILSVRLENPTGYGRLLRNSEDGFSRIVEQKDATDEERLVREVNTGIYCFETSKLFPALAQVEPANQQGEYYLTDVPAILARQGEKIAIYQHSDAREVSGINNRADLAEFENLLRRATIRAVMLEGVTFIDPSHTYVGTDAQIARDCVIYPDVHIEGLT
ncbi:MAG TPA: NTP transferase domain-containing protein, partial [Pyrinomonadaceae bacterium]|nr:NTP transferase domain-containing protein [Pyrinomonadaceae bacterium]